MKQTLAALAVGAAALLPAGSAQAYPIDCAILLCLAGGFPPSEPCAAARAEMIRRITPFPIEPPLQLWRCPMRASFPADQSSTPSERVFDIAFRRDRFPQSSVWTLSHPLTSTDVGPVLKNRGRFGNTGSADGATLFLAQDEGATSPDAGVDLTDPTYAFIRTIHVWHVRATQHYGSTDRTCNVSIKVEYGDYGPDGDYRWRRARGLEEIAKLPEAFMGEELFGDVNCPDIWLKSVFLDWRDYEGNYRFEQVNY